MGKIVFFSIELTPLTRKTNDNDQK
jgi:hypothetical protein